MTCFFFVVDPDILPQPGEIVFSKDHSEDGATMTWCYNQPRVITYLNITPVPFNLPQQLDARLINEHLKVNYTHQSFGII